MSVGAARAAIVLLAALASAAATAQDAQSPKQGVETSIRLRGDAANGTVEFGLPFEFDVERRWPAGTTPDVWSPELHAPLFVNELARNRTTTGNEVVETIRCRGFAFRRGGATLLRASAVPTTLLVDSCLPAGDEGQMELLPAPPLAVRSGRAIALRIAAIAAAAGIGAFALLSRWRAVRRRVAILTPRARLQQQLDALIATAAPTRAEQRAFAVAATAMLREAEQFATTPARVAEIATSVHALLDDVKFAGRALDAAARTKLHDVMQRAVAEVAEAPR